MFSEFHKKRIIFFALLLTAICAIPAFAEAGSSSDVVEADNLEEFSLATDAGTDTFLTVDRTDGETGGKSFKSVFGEKYDEKTAESVIEGSDMYVITDRSKDSYEVTSIFGTKRLVVLRELTELEGAVKGASYDGETILEFETEEKTKEAYDRLIEKYGEENVIVDLPVKADAVGWGTEYMNLDSQSELFSGETDTEVTVAVVDSGVTATHEIFSGTTILPDSKSFITSTIADDNGHGTYCAGIIAESTPSNVNLLILKALNGEGEGSSKDVSDAVRYAMQKGADVISLSLGESGSELKEKYPAMYAAYYSSMNSAYREAARSNILICAAAGNDGLDMGQDLTFPAISEYTYAVGALDTKNKRATYSNYGEKLDFCAPGSSVRMALYNTTSSYRTASGTSMATPYIASCLALLKMENKSLSFSAGKQALADICVDLGDSGKDIYYGYGMPRFEGSIESREFTLKPETYTYDGTEKKPEVTASGLTEGTDFTVTYENNVNAGIATAVITGIGKFTGTVRKSFTIEPMSITPAVSLDEYSFSYDGSEKKPGVIVKYMGEELSSDQYTVTYPEECILPGKYTVSVEMKGNYTGSGKQVYHITHEDVSVTMDSYTFTYDGQVKSPALNVKFAGQELSESDYSITGDIEGVNAGEYGFTITFLGDYAEAGSLDLAFTIEPKHVTPEIVFDNQTFTYDGSRKSPNISVMLDGKEISSDNYDLTTPRNPRSAGEYECTVVMKGNYAGQSSASYTIAPMKGEPVITLSSYSYTYDGISHRPNLVVRVGGRRIDSSDYFVTYPLDTTSAGEKVVHVELTGNYEGEGNISYVINRKAITPIIELNKDIFYYNGSTQRPEVTVYDGLIQLSEYDYVVTYPESSMLPGVYTISVELRGNYSGSSSIIYIIDGTYTEKAESKASAAGGSDTESGGSGDKTTTAKKLSVVSKLITTAKSDTDFAGSKFSPLKLRSKSQTKKKINLTWKKSGKAAKYVIYGNRCGRNYKMKRLAVLGAGRSSIGITKISGKKLKKSTYYKFCIVSVDASGNVLSISKTVHASTKGSRKKSNPTGVSVKARINKSGKKLSKYKAASRITLRAGSSSKALAKSTVLKGYRLKGKKTVVRKHRGIYFESSNQKVATVTKAGKVKAVKSGKCYIYAYAQNGLYKTITVIVK